MTTKNYHENKYANRSKSDKKKTAAQSQLEREMRKQDELPDGYRRALEPDKPEPKKSKSKALENNFARSLNLLNIPYRREVRLFAEEVGVGKGVRDRLNARNFNDFRFDFVIDELRLCIEVQGGVWMKGKTGHTSGTGVTRDCQKAFQAKRLGYSYLPVTGDMVKSGEVANWIADYLEGKV